jgi:hypothetical protein
VSTAWIRERQRRIDGPAEENAVKLFLSTLAAIGTAAVLIGISPAAAAANDRQQCLNDCTQAGTTATRQCHAVHDQQMIACGKLGTNQERNTCKKQAAAGLRSCAEAARQNVKTCQANCPPR